MMMTKFERSTGDASTCFLADRPPTHPLEESGLLGVEDDPRPSHSWSEAIDALLGIRSLDDDWDGQGADAPPPALVDAAITLAQTLEAGGLTPPHRVIAGVDGTVSFEWVSRSGYSELEVASPDYAELRTVRNGSEDVEILPLSRTL